MIPVFSPTLFMPKASGAAFNPTSLITGGGGFWRADMGVTSGSGVITVWADQSGNGNTLNTVTGGTDTVGFSATGFNTSFPAVQPVDGNNGSMRTASFPVSSTTVTIFILLSFKSGNTQSNGRICSLLSSSSSDDYDDPHGIELDNAGANKIEALNNLSSLGNGGSPSSVVSVGVPVLAGFVLDGTNANMWINGSVLGSATSNTSTIGSNPGIVNIGAGNAGTGTQAAGGTNVAFAGMTTKAMNSTDWTNLKNWSNSNWGTSF